MKYNSFTITFDSKWLFLHRNDTVEPIYFMIERLIANGLKFGSFTTTDIVMCYDPSIFNEEKINIIVKKAYQALGVSDEFDNVITISYRIKEKSEVVAADSVDDDLDEYIDEHEKAKEKAEADSKKIEDEKDEKDPNFLSKLLDDDDSKKSVEEEVQTIIKRIDSLVGAEEFKALAKEIIKVAPQIKKTKTLDAFTNQCYIFSIGDGCGLTTYLNLLADIIEKTKLSMMRYSRVEECALGCYEESSKPFYDAIGLLRDGESDKLTILCVDFSEWMEYTKNRNFKNFLRIVEKHANEFIVIFRIPFVDQDMLSKLKFSLSDLLTVRTVSFPPLGEQELRKYAMQELTNRGFQVSKKAWKYFDERISEEKTDGKFYGLNTINKVIKEIIYNKQVSNASKNVTSTLLTASDFKSICRNIHNKELTGEEELDALIGGAPIKQKIQEIIAQIQLAKKQDSSNVPCIHMRFLGNPGTGKTTVARIVGKMFREAGILRVGNFYECAGREFCGRYIGETAPKTASICRDALGSVLFIDEAYSLYRGNNDTKDFGKEALDTLIAEMENHRDDFVVIFAGYTDEMNTLMQGNSGLESRVPYTIEFPNFTRDELYEIFVSKFNKKIKHDDLILDAAKKYFSELPDEVLKSKTFSNARFVRNLFERTWAKAALRCQIDRNTIVIMTVSDFEKAINEKEFNFKVKSRPTIGF